MEELNKFFPATETMLVHGGMILTMDENLPEAQALVIKNGRIEAIGTKHEMSKVAGTDAAEIDVKGNIVLPGLIDTHPHLLHYGTLQEPLVDLSDATSHDDIVARITSRAAETEPGQWIMCSPVGEPHYFIRRSYKDLKEMVLPGREVLDRATMDHPVMIQAVFIPVKQLRSSIWTHLCGQGMYAMAIRRIRVWAGQPIISVPHQGGFCPPVWPRIAATQKYDCTASAKII